MLLCWQRTIYQEECLFIVFNVQLCQKGVFWVKKVKTLTTNPKYVTAGHYQENCPPCFKLAKFDKVPLQFMF